MNAPRHWVQLTATVDSSDVVKQTANRSATYSTRYWVSFASGWHDYHVPVRAAGSSNNYAKYAQRAAEARLAGRLLILVDPRNPYHPRDESPGFARSAVIVAVVFTVIGVLSLVLAVVFWRTTHKQSRA